MGSIYRNNVAYAGASGRTIEVTREEYNNLSDDEKASENVYFITDDDAELANTSDEIVCKTGNYITVANETVLSRLLECNLPEGFFVRGNKFIVPLRYVGEEINLNYPDSSRFVKITSKGNYFSIYTENFEIDDEFNFEKFRELSVTTAIETALSSKETATKTLPVYGTNDFTKSKDTVEEWAKKGNCYWSFTINGCINNQPSANGLVINTTNGDIVSQIWIDTDTNSLYFRSSSDWESWGQYIKSTDIPTTNLITGSMDGSTVRLFIN